MQRRIKTDKKIFITWSESTVKNSPHHADLVTTVNMQKIEWKSNHGREIECMQHLHALLIVMKGTKIPKKTLWQLIKLIGLYYNTTDMIEKLSRTSPGHTHQQ